MKKLGIGLLICWVYIDTIPFILALLIIYLLTGLFIIPFGAEVVDEFYKFSSNLTKIVNNKYLELKQEWKSLWNY